MVGFRRERNTASVPYRSNERGIGFRDNVNYFNFDPITIGPRVTDYIDFSNFVPSYVPPPPPPAPVYVPNDNGGGGGDSNVDSGGGHYGGFDHQSSYEGSYTTDNEHTHGYDGSASEPNDPGSVGGHSNNDNDGGNHGGGGGMGNTGSDDTGGSTGGGPSSGGTDPDANDDSGMSGGGGGRNWAFGGTIPPMYAYDGLTKQERDRAAILAQQEAARPKHTFDFTPSIPPPSELLDNAKGIANHFASKIPDLGFDMVDDLGNYINDKINTVIEDPITAATETARNAMFTESLLSLAPNLNPYVAGFAVANLLDSAKKGEGLVSGPNSEVDMSANDTTGYTSNPSQMDNSSHPSFGNLPEITATTNYGAIPGNYSAPNATITGAPTYSGFVPSTYDDFMADVAAEIAAIDSEYQDFTDSYSNTDFDDDDGGGYDPDNAGHSPGSNANASDSNTGMGMGIGGGNDGFRSAGGHIYASQGGYVNSTGGK